MVPDEERSSFRTIIPDRNDWTPHDPIVAPRARRRHAVDVARWRAA